MTKYRCAVMGNPIAHSKSPDIHQQFASEHRIDLVYDKILVPFDPIDAFEEAVNEFYAASNNIVPVGLNITLPFKVAAHDMAENLTDNARFAGAVNTFYKKDGVLVGDNTDGIGLCYALEHTHGHALKDKSVLIIGAGGAARGAIYPLLQAGVKQLSIANRTLTKAQTLIDAHQNLPADTAMTAHALDNIDNIYQHPFDFIINATSIGLENTQLSLPTDILHAQTVCYDMVYGKETAFLVWAKQHDVKYCYDGYSMLIAQACYSFSRWFGI